MSQDKRWLALAFADLETYPMEPFRDLEFDPCFQHFPELRVEVAIGSFSLWSA